MGDFLDMDNILTGDEAANLFLDIDTPEEDTQDDPEEKEEKLDSTTEVNSEDLFENEPESVGSKDDTRKKEDAPSDEDGSSPDNVYSSFASALKEEGIFSDLEDDTINSIRTPEDFKEAVQRLMEAGLDEMQKRIYDALNNGVQADDIKQYEQTLAFLNNVSEDLISEESDRGEDLRRRLIQQDLLNRGYSNERAVKMTEKLFASGEDIEEAKQALLGNKEYFGGRYNDLLEQAREKASLQKEEARKKEEKLKNDILKEEKIFGDIPIDRSTRQKVYDNIRKPAYKDPKTGKFYTALEKYRLDNENDYIKNVGLLFTLTDGFTNLEKIIKPSAKREVKQKLKELERTISSSKSTGGSLNLIGSSANKGSLFDRGFTLDIN